MRFPKLQIFVVNVFQKFTEPSMKTPCWCTSVARTPTWRKKYSVNIWNLLWLSRRLIISTKQTKIYISTFPNALTSKKAQNHEINIYFSTNSIVVLCQATSITLKIKMPARHEQLHLITWCQNEQRRNKPKIKQEKHKLDQIPAKNIRMSLDKRIAFSK